GLGLVALLCGCAIDPARGPRSCGTFGHADRGTAAVGRDPRVVTSARFQIRGRAVGQAPGAVCRTLCRRIAPPAGPGARPPRRTAYPGHRAASLSQLELFA